MTTTSITRWGYVRDTQQQRLYDAEGVIPRGREMTLAECQAYIDRLASSAWVRRHWKVTDRNTPKVKDGRGSPRTRYNLSKNTIEATTWGRNEAVMLHEFAHYLTSRCRRNCNDPDPGRRVRHCSWEAHHGWHFAATLLLLVRHFRGKAQHDALKASFKAGRVRYTKPRSAPVLLACGCPRRHVLDLGSHQEGCSKAG